MHISDGSALGTPAVYHKEPTSINDSRDQHARAQSNAEDPSSASDDDIVVKADEKPLQHEADQSTTSDDNTLASSQPKNAATIVWNESFDSTSKRQGTSRSLARQGGRDLKPRKRVFHLRGYDDDEATDWWFASTAVPLLAATVAPLANVLSIAALVTYWRMSLVDPNNPDVPLVEFSGIPYADPRWCYWLNAGSLICGFVGNVFLLANFTGRIRYIVALPVTIILWYIATAILIAITIAMNQHVPPVRPDETYSQGFWYAVIAAVLYLLCSFLLMFNMLGYFLGHYPQRFELNEHQRTLILQTMLFFIWLAGGGAIFSRIESRGQNGQDWSFVDGLYFCDVTILTVGFGDLVLRNDLGRALIFPYTVGGIIMLGLVISSISKFAADMSKDNVVRKHFEKVRTRTLERTTRDKQEWEESERLRKSVSRQSHMSISAPRNPHHLHHKVPAAPPNNEKAREDSTAPPSGLAPPFPLIRRITTLRDAVKSRNKKVRLLREERDRFDEMRRLQHNTQRFKNYWALSLSLCAFALLWLLGAVVFWLCERNVQGMSYFQGLYFCYVSLLTIGYGDFAPRSNAGRPFFVVWSLIAVPTITLLINDMGSTVIESFKRGTFVAADFTVLLRRGVWQEFLTSHPKIKAFFDNRKERKAREKRMKEGMPVGDEEMTPSNEAEVDQPMTADSDRSEEALDRLAEETIEDEIHAPTEAKLARHLSEAIKRVAKDINDPEKKYSFEEWAELTRLIRFTGSSPDKALRAEEEDVIDWDWLGEESPMMANISEPEFVMEKLCQSLARNMRRMDKKVHDGMREIERLKQADATGDDTISKKDQ